MLQQHMSSILDGKFGAIVKGIILNHPDGSMALRNADLRIAVANKGVMDAWLLAHSEGCGLSAVGAPWGQPEKSSCQMLIHISTHCALLCIFCLRIAKNS